jgi:antitoxin ParD1/3/4
VEKSLLRHPQAICAPSIRFAFLLFLGQSDTSRLPPLEEIKMPMLNVVLSEDHEALVADLVNSGQFHNANEVLQEGLRLVEAKREQDVLKEQKMRHAIQAGLDDLDQGRFESLSGRDEMALHLRNLGKR